MNKEFKIEIPKGYEIDEKLSTFDKIIFKKIAPALSAEDRMTQIWKECNTVKYSKDNCRTYLKGTTPMIQQDWDNKKLYYNYDQIYLIFEKEYNMHENDINSLVLKVVSKDLNCDCLAGPKGVFWWLEFMV